MKTIRQLSGLLITVVTVGTSMLIVSYKPQAMEFKSSVVSENKSIQELLNPDNTEAMAIVAGFDLPLNYIVVEDDVALMTRGMIVTDDTDETGETDEAEEREELNKDKTTEKKPKDSKETKKKEKKELKKEKKNAKVATARFNLSNSEITILERITEAEATGGSIEAKMNVANVILNRVKSDRFPNSVESVVFQKNPTQFSPTSDGRYWSVTVTKETKEAVKRALTEEDTIKGALYFCNPKDVKNLKTQAWFKKLTYIGKDASGHSFYR